MDPVYQPLPDVHVLPSTFPIPGVGLLTINSYVLHAAEPVLVDTGVVADGDEFVEALRSVVDPATLRWIWLTHDDSDHTGSLPRIMEMAPQARLVTNPLAALRMATWWPIPLDRVLAIRPGDEVEVGDRTLRAIPPPTFDNPMSTGILDRKTGALFSVDAFGAILPEVVQDAGEVPSDALVGGMLAWGTFDSPWTAVADKAKFGVVLDAVRELAPSTILSSHLPAAPGTSLDHFLGVLAMLPDAERFVAPDQDAFTQMLAALTAPPG